MLNRGISKETKSLLLILSTGESAHFERRTTWEKVVEPKDGCNVRALWDYLPRTETLDLSEQSTITLCF
jgi:hypothetical protein